MTKVLRKSRCIFYSLDKEIIELKEVFPGNIVYLTEDEVIADELTYIVEFNTKEINGVRLYEQELVAETAESNIVVKGFVPKDYLLNVVNEDPTEIQKLMEDMEEFKNTTVLAAYDITIMKEELEYQPVEFNQFVNVAITSKEKLESNEIIKKDIEMIHINETEEEKQNYKFERRKRSLHDQGFYERKNWGKNY